MRPSRDKAGWRPPPAGQCRAFDSSACRLFLGRLAAVFLAVAVLLLVGFFLDGLTVRLGVDPGLLRQAALGAFLGRLFAHLLDFPGLQRLFLFGALRRAGLMPRRGSGPGFLGQAALGAFLGRLLAQFLSFFAHDRAFAFRLRGIRLGVDPGLLRPAAFGALFGRLLAQLLGFLGCDFFFVGAGVRRSGNAGHAPAQQADGNA